jgi:hypothetical protein
VSEFKIKRAERTQARLRLALVGPSFSGKTRTALELARGIAEAMIEAGLATGSLEGKVGVIDTERQSASLYSDVYAFDVIELNPPYTVDRYISALATFERAGYSVVIIDQMSHAWVGQGGIMEQVQKAESQNAMAPWLNATPEQNRLVDTVLASPCHIIANMRAKTAWSMEERQNKAGRTVKVPVRIGMGIVQRPGIEYEFTTVLMLEVEGNIAKPIKDRTNLFPLEGARMGQDWGRRMVKWMLSAKTPDALVTVQATPRERAQAVTDVGLTRIARCETTPDLVRVFEGLIASLRAFKDSVEVEDLVAMRGKLIAAKDARKLALEGVPLPDVPLIDVDDAIALEQMLQAGGVAPADFFLAFEVQRIGRVPAGRLAEAAQWIHKHAEVDLALPARLAEKGIPALVPVGSFADMADDLPF